MKTGCRWMWKLGLAVALAWGAEVNGGATKPATAFEARDYLQRDWARTLVTYRVSGAEVRSRLVDTATGLDVPFQLSRVESARNGRIASARLSFFAALTNSGSYRVEWAGDVDTSTRRSAGNATDPALPRVSTQDGLLTLENGLTAIRLPAAGEVTFKEPLPFGQDQDAMVAAYGKQIEAGVAPGPFQGLRLADGRWVGGSFFWASEPARAPRVMGYACRITEQGPLFVEATIRYTFTGGGWYQFTARVLADDPAVRVDEQFDLGEPGSMWDYRLMVSLGNGWKPDTVYWCAPQVASADPKFEARLVAQGLTNEVSHNSRTMDYSASGELFQVAVRYPWTASAHYFGLVNLADEKLPFLGVVPMHSGNWRGSTDSSDGLLWWSYAAGDVCLNWRLRASPHPRSVLHTGEYDPALPLTFCRRQWALIGGAFEGPSQMHAFRSTEGFITLDDYKDWVLDWPANPKTTYPRLIFSKQEVERLKPRLDTLIGSETLKTFLYFNETDARRETLWKGLTADSEWSGPFGMARYCLANGDPGNLPWVTHFRLAQMAGWAGNMDELLSSDKLTPEQRIRLRRDLAALCYVLTEPDVNPRGTLTHLGNPNMPINRFMALPFSAALIPDHPMDKTWLDVSAQMLRYKLAMNTAPGGAWSELITYFGASAPHIMQAAAVLAASGRGDESTARLSAMPALFTLSLLTPPDLRFGGARELPNWGHEGADTLTHWLVASANIGKYEPGLARDFAWAWDRQGRPMNQHHDAGFSARAIVNAVRLTGVPSNTVPAALSSAWLPGFGATMRAHVGDPNETYLSLRQGYMCSHSDPNQGDFVLYAKGVPITTLSLHAYPLHQLPAVQELDKTFGWHSRVRFGSPGNTGGWPGGGAIGGVPGHSFSDSMDYLRAVGDYPPQQWTRQIAFLKAKQADGPDYFIMRDSFTPSAVSGEVADGEAVGKLEPKWWCLRTLGSKTQVQAVADGFLYQSEWGPRLQARFLQPAAVVVESRDVSIDTALYFGSARAWEKGGFPVKATQGPDNATVVDTLTVNAVGPVAAGQDILVALTPLGRNEALPKSESLGDGVVRITTSESVDYVFLGRNPLTFAQGDVEFEGIAGAVRVYSNEVHLIMGEGPGRVSYRGTTLRSEGSAVKVVPTEMLARNQSFVISAPASKLKNAVLPKGCWISGDARSDVTIENDRIVGRSEGTGGFLYAPLPPGLRVLPMLVIDGQTYAPGVSGNQLIIPLMPGKHEFEVRALVQPPIFRNWQAW